MTGRAVMSLPCVKGGGLRSKTEGLLKQKFHRKTIPQSPSVTAPFTQGSLWFVRHESPSTFPDKHCFCGHKSKAPREAGQNIILKLAICFLLLVIFHRNASTQTEDFHLRNKGSRKPYYIHHCCRSAKNHILIHEPKEMYVLYS